MSLICNDMTFSSETAGGYTQAEFRFALNLEPNPAQQLRAREIDRERTEREDGTKEDPARG